ncbi:MAG TPA: hypothetical protein EYP54_06790 [Anaerolineales bacterium]|nr:hypothetical protein [Anaerolineales bacterium]
MPYDDDAQPTGMLEGQGEPHPVAFALAFFAHVSAVLGAHPLYSHTDYNPLLSFARLLLLWWGVLPGEVDKAWRLFQKLGEELDANEADKVLMTYHEAAFRWVREDKKRAALWYVHSVALAVLQHQQFVPLLGEQLPAPVLQYLKTLRAQLPGFPLPFWETKDDDWAEVGAVLGLTASLLYHGGAA